MGTNFYCKRIPTQEQLNSIAKLVVSKQIDEAIDKLNEVNEKIHICKCSCGWQVGFDHNNGEYYEPTRKSLEEFLSQPGMVIIDEYNNEYSYDEFWKKIDEHNANPHNIRDSKKYMQEITISDNSSYICLPDIRKVKELFDIDT